MSNVVGLFNDEILSKKYWSGSCLNQYVNMDPVYTGVMRSGLYSRQIENIASLSTWDKRIM